MPKSEQLPIQEPTSPEDKPGSLEEIGPKTKEQQKALSRAVSAALEEAERENADIKAGRTSTPADILREVVTETRAENKRTRNTPLNTGSSIQMAFKEAIDPEKAQLEKNEGMLIGAPGNPRTQKDVLDNLTQMGKISRDGEGRGEKTEVLRRWPFTKPSPREKKSPESTPPTPKPKTGKTAEKASAIQTGNAESLEGDLVAEKQRLIKLGKGRRTPKDNERLREIEDTLKPPAGEKPKKDRATTTAPTKPHLSGTEAKKFLEDQRLKREGRIKSTPEKTTAVVRPTGDWEKKRLSTVGRIIKKLEKKREKMSPEEKRDLERLVGEKEKLLSGWKKEDFEILAYKRRLEKPANPVSKEHLEKTLKELTDSKFTPEQLAEFARNKVELDAKTGTASATASSSQENNGDQRKENSLRIKPALSGDDIEFLIKRGWQEKDFDAHRKVFGLKKGEREAIENAIVHYEKEMANYEARETEGKIFPGEKAQLENLRKAVARLKGDLTLQNKREGSGKSAKNEKEEVEAEPEGKILTPEEWEKSEQVARENRGKRGSDIKETEILESTLPKPDTKENIVPKSTLFMKGEKGVKEIFEPISPADKERLARKNRETREKSTGIKESSDDSNLEKLKDHIEKLPPSESALAKKAVEALQKGKEEVEKEAEEKGLLGPIRAIGKWMGAKDPKTRLAIGLALTAAALTAGTASAGVGAVIGAGALGWRALGGTALFVGVEKSLIDRTKKKYEREGKKLKAWRKTMLTGEALAFSVLLGGGLLGQGAHNVMEFFNPSPVLAETVTQVAKTRGVGAPAETAAENIAEEIVSEHTVSKGENLYSIIKANFPEIRGLSGGQQTNAIENILADIKNNPGLYGIQSEDVNKLAVGDKINLNKIQEVLSTKTIGGENIIEHAQNLSAETLKNIEAYVPPETVAQESTVSGVVDPYEGLARETIKDSGGVVEVDITGENEGPNNEEGSSDQSQTNTGEARQNAAETNFPNKDKILDYIDDPKRASLDKNFDRHDIMAVENARAVYHGKLDEVFGKKGFLGFGGTSGIDSPEWKTLGNKPINSLFLKVPATEATQKLGNLISSLAKESGIIPNPQETSENFIKKSVLALVKAGKMSAV